MSACAAPRPAPEIRVACAPMQYFTPAAKPVPPEKGLREFLLYVDELSLSWDNLYIDRLKARAIILEGLEVTYNGAD